MNRRDRRWLGLLGRLPLQVAEYLAEFFERIVYLLLIGDVRVVARIWIQNYIAIQIADKNLFIGAFGYNGGENRPFQYLYLHNVFSAAPNLGFICQAGLLLACRAPRFKKGCAVIDCHGVERWPVVVVIYVGVA